MKKAFPRPEEVFIVQKGSKEEGLMNQESTSLYLLNQFPAVFSQDAVAMERLRYGAAAAGAQGLWSDECGVCGSHITTHPGKVMEVEQGRTSPSLHTTARQKLSFP